jgi:hypothetical protein
LSLLKYSIHHRAKQLITLHFTPNKAENRDVGMYQCPVTGKTLTNETGGIAFKRCGHVVSPAGLKMIEKEETCPVCNKPFRKKDLITLKTGGLFNNCIQLQQINIILIIGTGFASETDLKALKPTVKAPAPRV